MRNEVRSVRYYCTAGGGMETFLAKEVKLKLRATEVEHIPGRVFFCCSSDLQDVLRLKCAERLFLLLRRGPHIPLPRNPAKASNVIQQSIVGSPDAWNHAFVTWTSLQVEDRGRGHKRKRDAEEEREEGGASCSLDTACTNRGTTHMGSRSVSVQAPPTFRVSCRCSGAMARCYNSQTLSRIIGTAITQQLGWKADLREPTLEVNVYLSDDHSVIGISLIRYPLASRSYMKYTGLRSTIAWAMTSLCPMKEASVILDPMCGVGTILLEAAQECPDAVFIGLDTEERQLQKAVENVATAGQKGRILLAVASCMAIPLSTESVDVVLCDIPFGRKFSCSLDMATALPRILAEMERVLHEGGYLIILLSLQLSAQIKKLLKSDTLNPQSRSQGGVTSPARQDAESPDHSGTTQNPALTSLCLQNTHRVSLGNTDAVIHTYTKTIKST